MSMRDEFEKRFPVPKDVEWCGNGYAPTKYSADQGYNRMWKVWQAAQAPASGEVVGEAERLARKWLSMGVIDGGHLSYDDITIMARALAHPPAKVPEGLTDAIKAIADKMEKVEGESADGGYMWDARDCAEFIREEADLLATPTPATTAGAEWVKCPSCGDFAYECDVCGGKPTPPQEQ